MIKIIIMIVIGNKENSAIKTIKTYVIKKAAMQNVLFKTLSKAERL